MSIFFMRSHPKWPLRIAAAVAVLAVPARIAWRRWCAADRARRIDARARNWAVLAAELEAEAGDADVEAAAP